MTDPIDAGEDETGGSLYSLKAVLNKQPVTIAATIGAGLNVAVAFDWVHVTSKQLGAVNTFLILLMALFLNAKTENKAKLKEFNDAMAEGN